MVQHHVADDHDAHVLERWNVESHVERNETVEDRRNGVPDDSTPRPLRRSRGRPAPRGRGAAGRRRFRMKTVSDAMTRFCDLPGTRRHGAAAPFSSLLTTAFMALSLAALPAPRASGSPGVLPERFAASFVLSARGLDIGRIRWQLAPVGPDRYVYQSHSETVGMAKLLRDERIDERSEWRFADGDVRPLHYTYLRTGGKREREVEVHFDWEKRRVHNTLNGESWSMPIETGTLDKLVYLLALMQDLARGVRETRYAVADGGKVKTYILRVIGHEQLETVLGNLDTVVVERRRMKDDRVTLVWCAPALSYLPVRVEHREEDGTVHLSLTSLEGISLP
jgi:hypothetical protein